MGIYSGFQLSVESNPELLWFCFIIGLKKLAPPSQPIRCKTKTNRYLITRVFPRLRIIFASSSHWLFLLFTFFVIGRWFWFYDTPL